MTAFCAEDILFPYDEENTVRNSGSKEKTRESIHYRKGHYSGSVVESLRLLEFRSCRLGLWSRPLFCRVFCAELFIFQVRTMASQEVSPHCDSEESNALNLPSAADMRDYVLQRSSQEVNSEAFSSVEALSLPCSSDVEPGRKPNLKLTLENKQNKNKQNTKNWHVGYVINCFSLPVVGVWGIIHCLG